MTAARDLLVNVIQPTLIEIGLDSLPAQQILLGTVAIESDFVNRRQIGGGPALGLWEIENATHHDCWVNYLNARPDLARKIIALCPPDSGAVFEQLEFNDPYACAMARVKYLRAPGAIPGDLAGQAEYYKRTYNTAGGASTVDRYLAKWDAHACAAAFADEPPQVGA